LAVRGGRARSAGRECRLDLPAALTDEGLAAAVEALAEKSPIEIDFDGLPNERFHAPVVAAAYFLVAEALKRGRATRLTVAAAPRDGHLGDERD
jgi:signal transduction histidine kinase